MKKLLKKIDKHLLNGVLYKLYRKIINIKLLKMYKTDTGNYYLPRYAIQDAIRNDIIGNKIFDEDVYEIAKFYIKDNSIILDAGANYGQLSILFSKLKVNTVVYSFESSKYIYNILKKNIEINKANCLPFNYILGDESLKKYNIKKSELNEFNTYGSNKVEFLSQENNNSEIVETLQIDDLKFNNPISFFKIDVQGYDLKVLKGAKKTILEHKMPIVFEYEKIFSKDFCYDFSDFENFINEIDYKIKDETNNNFLIVPR